MDVVFVIPPSTYSDQLDYSERKGMPLGPLHLAAHAIKNGYSADIIQESIDQSIQRLKEVVTNETVIGISTMSGFQLGNGIKLAVKIKSLFPNNLIVWGGAHPTALPEQTIKSGLADLVVWGEGEVSLLSILRNRHTRLFDNIQGICYKNGDQIILTDRQPYTDIFSSPPLPYYMLNMDHYARKMIIGFNRCYSIMTSRGCPFYCKFCSNASSFWPNRKMRYHSNEFVLHDIAELVTKYNADGITIADENFVINFKRVRSLLESIQREFPGLGLRISARADILSRLDDRDLKFMRSHGIVGISVGIESGSEKMLERMGKGTTLAQIYKCDANLSRHGFYKTYNFMTMMPEETKDDLRKTLALIGHLARNSKYTPYPFGALSYYIPLPNTEMFKMAIENGFSQPTDIFGWSTFDTINPEKTLNIVRPWLTSDLARVTVQASDLIIRLNELFTGNDCDKDGIDLGIHELEQFASSI